ncbi:ABC transporter substrate-binding protein [Brachybacterium saurashtrense]|uniref:Glycine/betaine ABC transporter substrate-binding protein n=1 Tax=Brachybacterium saurashtrense TaxID=556288 RepID=A0A345YQK2_9MICO|nr:ABC transporter substrate-binding protein [Brachybacterium saurashtrense]AXK46204.1 glycine/betaine ABC transporter substrate-binding protein [Brachybacterium saurashtrense]RRR23944.1 glycine/betaine ABC transporter substrate-binding protein [Brachybacterium saurashtrense]
MNTSTSTRRPGTALRMAAATLGVVLALSGCVQSGRTSHPDNFAGETTCPVEPDPSITTSARIAWQAIPNGDLVVKDLQLLEACMPEAQISWLKMNSGGDVIQAFGSDSLDISQVGSSPAVKAASPPLSKEIKVIWISDVIGEAESLVVKDPAIESLDDMSGKTIGVPFGSTAHYSLLTALGEEGLSGDVRVINLAPDAILAAWQRDEIDAAWIWEPTLSELLGEEGHTILSSEDSAGLGAPTFDLVAGTEDFISGNPDFMRMWTLVQAEGTRILNEEPELAATSISVQLGVEKEDAQDLLDGYLYPTLEEQAGEEYFGGDGLADALTSTAEFLESQDGIDALADGDVYEQMPYGDAIEEVAK